MFKYSDHIVTVRQIRSFRSCPHATGPSTADGDRLRIARRTPVGRCSRPPRAFQTEVIARKWAAATLRESEGLYYSLFSRMPAGIALSEVLYNGRGDVHDYRIIDVNPAYEAIFEVTREEAANKALGFHQVSGVSPLEMYGRVVATGEPATFETTFRPTRRSFRITTLATGKGRFAEVFEEITERKSLEQQLYHAQKMEAIGRLASGFAHDFNNLLTVILSYSDLVLEQLGSDDPRRADIEEIHKAGQNAASLTHQLLTLGRSQILQLVTLDLNAVVADMDKMLRRVIGEDIEIFMRLEPGLGSVKADAGQIEQIIMNLVVNARDAMEHGGKLTIETCNVDLDKAYARKHASVIPGPHVMLAVSDTGHGMDADTQARIFEPFFTTKVYGKGTGLGLSTVYGIVKQSGGSISVYSEPNHGSTFKIYLPHAGESGVPVVVRREPTGQITGTESILLVEDSDGIRELAARILRRYGYTVLQARRPTEAVAICQRHQDLIHLLLTDIVMPDMNGYELAQHLAAQRPEIKVLFTSGYANQAIVQQGVLDADIAFLQKPFTADALARRVREVLDSPPSTRGL